MTSSLIPLTYAGGLYDRTEALATGEVQPEGLQLTYLELEPPETFFRMLQFQEFESSELSCANYFTLLSRGDTRFIAIPVFPSRAFRHSSFYVNTEAGIREPVDLKGKRLGCPEYTMTMAIWLRGILQHEYGVMPQDVTWVQGGIETPGRKSRIPFKTPEGVRIEQSPDDRSLSQMLESGEIDAMLSTRVPSVVKKGSPRVARLFPDYPAVEAEYFRRTGMFPIMHTMVLRRDVYERYPWAAQSLTKAFTKAKDLAVQRLDRYEGEALSVSLAWAPAYLEQEKALRGDVWPYGFEANRATLETLKQYLLEQGLLDKDFAVEEAFAPNTLQSFKV